MKLLGRGVSLRIGGRKQFAAGLLLMTMTCSVGRTQHTSPDQMPGLQMPGDASKSPDGSNSNTRDPGRAATAERQAKMRNEERQRQLVADSDKLLTLATQLHEDVAKTNKDILSIEVVRRATEIEKLAHNVKERMKD